jgi:hypothetical protein
MSQSSSILLAKPNVASGFVDHHNTLKGLRGVVYLKLMKIHHQRMKHIM